MTGSLDLDELERLAKAAVDEGYRDSPEYGAFRDACPAYVALALIARVREAEDAQEEWERIADQRAEKANDMRIRAEAAEAKLAAAAETALEPLAALFKKCCEASWEGSQLDGGEIQEIGAALGLLVSEPYNPEEHGPNDDGIERGEPWFTYSPMFLRALKGEPDRE